MIRGRPGQSKWSPLRHRQVSRGSVCWLHIRRVWGRFRDATLVRIRQPDPVVQPPGVLASRTPVLHSVLVFLCRVHYHSDRKKSVATSDSSWSCPAQHRRGRAWLLSFRASLATVVAVSLSGHFRPVLF
jgi:hypothetical protein